MALVSVGMPIHNAEGCLGECLESVAVQPVDDLEVIMVDDGSTDASADIATDYPFSDDPALAIPLMGVSVPPRFVVNRVLAGDAGSALAAAARSAIRPAQGRR